MWFFFIILFIIKQSLISVLFFLYNSLNCHSKKLVIISRVTAKQNQTCNFCTAPFDLWVVQKYQIGSDTSQSAHIFTGLSELQSSLRHYQIFSLWPKRPHKDPLKARNTRFLYLKQNKLHIIKFRSNGIQLTVKLNLPLKDMS